MTFKIPKAMGAVADLLYSTRKKRLELQKQVDELQSQETALKDHIIATLPKSQASGVAGRLARVAVESKEVPTVEDWDAFHKYVAKNKRFDLLQKRISSEAVNEMLEDGVKLPGVRKFKATVVSINKV